MPFFAFRVLDVPQVIIWGHCLSIESQKRLNHSARVRFVRARKQHSRLCVSKPPQAWLYWDSWCHREVMKGASAPKRMVGRIRHGLIRLLHKFYLNVPVTYKMTLYQKCPAQSSLNISWRSVRNWAIHRVTENKSMLCNQDNVKWCLNARITMRSKWPQRHIWHNATATIRSRFSRYFVTLPTFVSLTKKGLLSLGSTILKTLTNKCT